MFGDWTATGPVPVGTLLRGAAAAAAALVVLYVLKPRLRTVEVPFAGLWAALLKESKSSVWWRRLRRLLSLLVQALVAGLLFVGAADPRSEASLRAGRHILVLLDASASMKALDGKVSAGPPGRHTRLEEAKEAVRRLLARKAPRDRVMLVQMDSQINPLTGWEESLDTLQRALERVRATDAPADLLRALRFAVDVLRTTSDPLLVLVGDGAYPESVRRKVLWKAPKEQPRATGVAARPGKGRAPAPKPLGGGAALAPVVLGKVPVKAILVGRSRNNVGIVAFSARRHLVDRSNYEVFARIQNFRKRAADVRLELSTGGQIPDTARLHLGPGEAKTFIRRSVPAVAAELVLKLLPTSGRGPLDDLPLDDVAYALVPERSAAKVLLVSEGNLYLEGALLLDERMEYDRIPHQAYELSKVAGHNVVIFDGYHGEPLPKRGNVLIFDPDPDKSPIPVVRRVANPPIMWPSEPKHRRHPIMRFVTLKNVNTVEASVFRLSEGDEPLMMTDERGPVFAAVRHRNGRKLVVVGFSLKHTDWVIRVSFPVFVLEAIDWFLGTDPRLVPTYRTGRFWRIPVDTTSDTVVVLDPLRRRFLAPVESGRALVYGRMTGYYSILAGRSRQKVAANLANASESDIHVPERLVFGPKGAERTLERPNIEGRAGVQAASGNHLGWGLGALLVGIALLVLALSVGRTGALWAFGAAVLLAAGTALVVWSFEGRLWSAAAVGAVAVLLAEWLSYNRRVTV